MATFKTTQATETNRAPFSVVSTTYYTERKITPAEYKAEFGKGYALKKGQKLITVRDTVASPTPEQIETAKLKN
jgi:hypothetical protein